MSELILAGEALPTPAELNNLSSQMLREELAKSIELSARHLMRLAAIWMELERRGEDLSDLRVGLAAYLPHIAAGQLSADAVLRFAGQRTLLNMVATLPIDEQQRLARGGAVKLLTQNPDGDIVEIDTPAHALTAAQVRQVFDQGKIRTPAEQRPRLQLHAAKPKPKAREAIHYHPSSGVVSIGRKRVPLADIIAAVSASKIAAPQAEEGEERKPLPPLPVTPDQHRALRIHAARTGETMTGLQLAALHALGLLTIEE
ncbi:hypothetical protein CEK28_08525 [Xenophilus sp. AP218F]|nr:hypothetical protein CEK28_08525 [Xenophilus sp. AP218F]